MNLRKISKWIAGVVLAAILLAAAGWIAFVPSPQGPEYAFVKAWGGQGAGPGQFHDPTGIAVSADEVFVSDARNSRIQVFDYEGRFKRQFGGKAGPLDAPGRLGRPMNLVVAAGELFVADYWNDRIVVFTTGGRFLRSIGGKGSGVGQFKSPGGVAVTPAGHLIVADFYNQRVQELDAQGGFIRQWGLTGQAGAWGGKFSYPTDVALGADGTIYVADGYNDRIQAIAPGGEVARKWGGPFGINITGPFNGWFAVVTSLALDGEGNLFAADYYNHRVQKFAPDGTFLAAFGSKGSGPGEFNFAMGVAAGRDGSVFVTDFLNHRIQKWRALR